MDIEFNPKSKNCFFFSLFFSNFKLSFRLPSLKNLIVIDQKEELAGDNVTRFSQLMKLGRCDKQLSDMLDPDNLSLFDDVINIQFTSGTTGSPKGAMLTNHNIIQNVRFTCPILFEGYTGDERAIICVPNPLYHCFGSVTGSASSIYSGATMVLPAPIFNVQSTLAAIDRYRFVARLPFKWKSCMTTIRLGVTTSMALRPCGLMWAREAWKSTTPPVWNEVSQR